MSETVTSLIQKREPLKNYAKSTIPPEKDEGNEEYKLKLFDVSPERLENLATQMRYRIEEGKGDSLYTLGVTDDGGVIGLTQDEYEKSLIVLKEVCNKNNYSISLLTEHHVEKDKKMYEFLIRENNPTQYIDLRVAITGGVDAGKTSLLGMLLTGVLDNSRGSSRLNVFNFPHEVKTGRTSSIAQHILGFDSLGNIVNYTDFLGRKKTWPEIVKNSSKIVTFFDLCGHEKYLKTTILGLTSHFPDLVFIIVGSNMGLSKMTKEHMFLCLSLHIPFVIIISKIDMCKNRPEVIKETVSDVKKLITSPGVRRIPYDIKDETDVLLSVKNINGSSIVPFFYTSSVTGEGIPYLKSFLNLYSRNIKTEKSENNVEMHLDQVFQVVGVGTVLGGQLVTGNIKTGDKLLIGPIDGKYHKIQVRSIHCKRTMVNEVSEGCYVCLAIKKTEDFNMHRGNIIISLADKPIQVWEFSADIIVLKSHATTIKVGYQPILHVSSVRQAVRIISIKNKICGRRKDTEENNEGILRTGDRATIRFRFSYRSEYIKKGVRILLCEGSCRLIGKITEVIEQEVL
jgi:GTPase